VGKGSCKNIASELPFANIDEKDIEFKNFYKTYDELGSGNKNLSMIGFPFDNNISIVEFKLYKFDNCILKYNITSSPQVSGSPIFDLGGKIVGMHLGTHKGMLFTKGFVDKVKLLPKEFDEEQFEVLFELNNGKILFSHFRNRFCSY
jgi:hypothetical protein